MLRVTSRSLLGANGYGNPWAPSPYPTVTVTVSEAVSPVPRSVTVSRNTSVVELRGATNSKESEPGELGTYAPDNELFNMLTVVASVCVHAKVMSSSSLTGEPVPLIYTLAPRLTVLSSPALTVGGLALLGGGLVGGLGGGFVEVGLVTVTW